MQRLTIMKAAQTAATTGVMAALLHRICENPVAAMWVTANAEKAKEYVNRRLVPAMMDCLKVHPLMPAEWTTRLVQFATMDLMVRGAVSKQDMTSDPAGLVVCDERREWQISIELVRQRLKTFNNAQEISIGTAGMVNDSLHRDWLEGSQGFIYFACPKCSHSQPFRFGRKASPLFPEKRELGGVVWPDDERTRNFDGTWRLEPSVREDGTELGDGVRSLAAYQCERCGDWIPQSARMALLRGAVEFHRQPRMLEKLPSLHWPAAVMPGRAMDFGASAVSFLSANKILKEAGDSEPLRYFTTDEWGEPWEMMASKIEASDVLKAIGSYHVGERYPAGGKPTVLVLTLDRQKDYLIYVLREWQVGGASRLVRFGHLPDDFEEVRKFQIEHRIKILAGDDGGYEDKQREDDEKNFLRWRVACVRYGWYSLKGDKAQNFLSDDCRKYWKHPKEGIATGAGNLMLQKYILWSKSHYLNKLYNVFFRGEGPEWQLPKNIPTEYLHHLEAYKYAPERGWWPEGADHAASCELMQLVVADAANIVQLGKSASNEQLSG
jgi:hypothetical protein